MILTEAHLQFADARTAPYLRAYLDNGCRSRPAAVALGCGKSTVNDALAVIKHNALTAGFSPEHDMTHTVPRGLKLKGLSTLYDGEGAVRAQWVKSTADAEEREAMVREFFEALGRGVKGLAPYVPPPAHTMEDLLAVYPIGDQHHGMRADARETGVDWDVKISQRVLAGAIDHLVAGAPPARDALLLNLGDFLHINDSKNATPESGARLDVDTRYPEVAYSGAMALVNGVLRLLEKHERVHVWNMKGNHDVDSSQALTIGMSMWFHDEPRVIVDRGMGYYKYLRYGKNLIGSTHGHGAKADDLPLIMAVDRPTDWGETQHRVWHCGHVHHKTLKENPGCDVEHHRTLAPGDDWHKMKGYRSKRGMQMITYHREIGEVDRHTFNPAMLVHPNTLS